MVCYIHCQSRFHLIQSTRVHYIHFQIMCCIGIYRICCHCPDFGIYSLKVGLWQTSIWGIGHINGNVIANIRWHVGHRCVLVISFCCNMNLVWVIWHGCIWNIWQVGLEWIRPNWFVRVALSLCSNIYGGITDYRSVVIT